MEWIRTNPGSVPNSLRFLFDWLYVKEQSKCSYNCPESNDGLMEWIRPNPGMKEIDFLKARTLQFQSVAPVKEMEAVCLLEALHWVCSLGPDRVEFEVDAKAVVVPVCSGKPDVTEFGSIRDHCRQILCSDNVFSLSFTWGLANVVAHRLARAGPFFASPTCLMFPSLCCQNVYE
ncbi:hypothetical protein PTKIN_Ptkin04bG0007400 [Pterospermum kingtungense]